MGRAPRRLPLLPRARGQRVWGALTDFVECDPVQLRGLVAKKQYTLSLAFAVLATVGAAGCRPIDPSPNASPKPTAGSVGLVVAQATVDPSACPPAEVEGTLIEDPDTGLGLLQKSGIQLHVVWPAGYSAGPSVGGSNLFDDKGSVLARSGENLRVRGFVVVGSDRIQACGPISKVSFN
jgi:hypothetical protein